MAEGPPRVRLRSVGPVFRLERRLYRIDRWAVPVPGGIPYRAIAGAAAALLAVWLAGFFPVAGDLLGALPAPVRWVVLPAGAGLVAAQATPDGRAAHRWLATWVSFPVRARRRVHGRDARGPLRRRVGGTLAVGADLSLRGRQAIRLRGPAVVRFTDPVWLGQRGPGAFWAQPVRRRRRRGVTRVQEAELLAGEHLELIP